MAEKQMQRAQAPQPAKAAPAKTPSFTAVRSPLVQRKCACGGTPGADGECDSCRRKRLSMQRSATDSAPVAVPNVVRDVLRSSGQPLDSGTRQGMESRFGHDFGGVRIHTDSRAADSARAVHATAYTVGQHIAFAPGQYQPHTGSGQRLLAHELAHTIQQQGIQRAPDEVTLETTPAYDSLEREAEAAADAAVRGASVSVAQRPPRPLLSRQGERNWVAMSPTRYVDLVLPVVGNQRFYITHQHTTPGVSDAIAYRVSKLVLPHTKGNVLQVYRDRVGASALESSTQMSAGFPAVLRQGRDSTTRTLQAWAEGMGWDWNCRGKLWHEAGGHPALTGAAPAPCTPSTAATNDTLFERMLVGSESCNVDHKLELQFGGSSMPSNYQMLEAGGNQQAGIAILTPQRAEIARTIRDREFPDASQPRPTTITLHYDSVEMEGGTPPTPADVNCATVRQGRAQHCWQIEYCAAQVASCASALCGTAPAAPGTTPAAGAAPTTTTMTISAGGTRADVILPARPASGTTTVPLWDDPPGAIPPQNLRAADMIAGLYLKDYILASAPGTASAPNDRIQAYVDMRAISRRTAARPPAALASSATGMIEFSVNPSTGELVRRGRSNVLRFFYPYLSEGTLNINYDPSSGLTGTGTIRPSLPFLSRASVNVRYERGQLTAVAPIPANRIAPPGVRVTRGELGLELSPEFRPYGVLNFEAGPSARPIFTGELNAGVDANGLTFNGTINAHLPRIDNAQGTIQYQNSAWSGFIVINSTQIGIPGIRSGELRVDYSSAGPVVSGSVVLEVAGQEVTLSAVRRGSNWVYRGRGVFTIPRLRPVNLDIETDGNRVTGSARTGIDIAGFSGDVTVNYRDGAFSGEGTVRFARGRANGSATIRVSRARRISGTGQITYQLTPDLIGNVGIDMPETGPVRVSGSLEFTRPIQLFRRFGNDRELFRRSFDIPIPGASIGPIGLQARLGAGLGINYFIGPGEIRNIRVQTAFNPLEENPNIEIEAGAQLVIPAGAGLWVSIEGGVAISAYIASISGTIRATGRAQLEGGFNAGITITYRQSRFAVEAPLELIVRPRITLSLDAVAAAEAGVSVFSVRTEKVWNLASYSWGAGFEVGLRTRLAYASDTGFQIPSLDEIEFIRPDIDVGAILSQVFGSSSSQEREV
jgi:hypothetical protein